MRKFTSVSTVLAGVIAMAPMAGLAQQEGGPAYKVTVATGRTKAINYRYLGGWATIGFHGTVLLPQAEGRAKVKVQEGGATVHAVFEHLEPAARFGPEYMTYVLWAVSPAGRVTNLGEVLVKGSGRAKIEAKTNLQTFGLIVTAEPHFAVTSVSDLVVLENVLTEGNRNKAEEVEAHYPLLSRGGYVLNTNPSELKAPKPDRRVSPYVHQARNAMRIALESEADRYAPDLYLKAEACHQQLEADQKQWKRPAVLLARQTIQLAEDARVVAVRTREETQLAEARKAAEAASLQAAADRARAEADAARAAHEAELAKEQASKQAAKEATHAVKRQIRRQLADQLGQLLQTQDTERGLIVRMSHLLFPTGKAELAPAAREKLAKVAGILLAYPGLTIKVEGHADSTGKPAFNQKLSEQRAAQVRAYLAMQGVSPQAITAEGLGASQPLTSNDTPTGRQKNRRVEMIVAGEPIGI